MNSSQFMDKQITALSGSQGGEFFDLMTPQEEHQSSNGGVLKNEEILPSYDFQPIRSLGSSSPMNTGLDGPRPSRGSADSKMSASNLRYSSILEPHELAKVSNEKERDSYDLPTFAEEIDCAVKKHVDNLLHALEGVSSRLSQLESRTRHLESSVEELKVSVGNNNGSTDGKLRQLENILREVQTCTQVMRDKQEIAEAQLQLEKQQISKADHPLPDSPITGQPESWHQPASQQQSVWRSPQTPVDPCQLPSLSSLPAPNALPPPPQQNPSLLNPALLLQKPYFPPPSQSTDTPHQQYKTPDQQQQPLPPPPAQHYQPSPQMPQYFPLPGQSTDTPHQQYEAPLQQQQPLLPQPPPAQHYQPSPQMPQYSQPVQPPQPANPTPQFQPPLPHHPEESAYMPPPQTYPSSIRQPAPLTQPPSRAPPQQHYVPSRSMYEPPTNRPGSGQLHFPAGYGPPSGPSFSELYPHSGSPSHHSSSMKPSPFASSESPFSSSAPSKGGSGSYPRLPTAQILPQAVPAGSSSSGTTGNRVPVDDVVDKVTTMGFSRDQVRATVRKLTENGQSVDLNVVLDKLMNGGEIQPQKGWFGR